VNWKKATQAMNAASVRSIRGREPLPKGIIAVVMVKLSGSDKTRAFDYVRQ
jgi:hypothetical protein